MGAKLITLLTDFGYKDPFVGIMKGVILGINPNAQIVDLTHGIPPQDIMAGALMLRYAFPFFPQGTIHVAVVDPGVGTERRPLLVEAVGRFLVGPDNGILSLALEGTTPMRIIELSNDLYHLKPTSSTFHGRDLFAPVAGYLSLGIQAQDFGTKAEDLFRLPWPKVASSPGVIQGEIIYIDGFGNLITNIHRRDLRPFRPESLVVSIGGLAIHGIAPSYANDGKKGFIALINSWDLVEISVFSGNAHKTSGAKLGDRVEIREGSKAR